MGEGAEADAARGQGAEAAKMAALPGGQSGETPPAPRGLPLPRWGREPRKESGRGAEEGAADGS